MPFAFGPTGFDDERKKGAEDAEDLLTDATALFGVLTAGSAIVFPPLAAGFALAAAVGTLLTVSMRRIRKDPPRVDFTRSYEVPPPSLDPTRVFATSFDPREFPEGFVSAATTYALGGDRLAAHLDALVTTVERAMGAYASHAEVALSLRVAEARAHAIRALGAAAAVTAAIAPLQAVAAQYFEDLEALQGQFDPSRTLEECIKNANIVARLLDAGVEPGFLLSEPGAALSLDRVTPHTLDESARKLYELCRSIASALPQTAQDFAGAAEGASASANA